MTLRLMAFPYFFKVKNIYICMRSPVGFFSPFGWVTRYNKPERFLSEMALRLLTGFPAVFGWRKMACPLLRGVGEWMGGVSPAARL